MPDPQAILGQALRRALRPAEQLFLSETLSAQERRIEALERQVAALQPGHHKELSREEVMVSLAPTGALRVRFPDQHSVNLPLGITQASLGLAMQALVRVLEERLGQKRIHTVGTTGAPVQYDLSKILKIPPKQKREVTLDDLDAIMKELP